MTEAVAKQVTGTVAGTPADGGGPGGRRKRWLLGGLAAIVVIWGTLVTAAELFWPGWVEKRLSQELSQRLSLDITLDKVTTDAIPGILHLYNLQVKDLEGNPLIGFKELHLDYSWLSILSPTWLIESAELIGPEIHAVLPAEGQLNLLKMLPPPSGEQVEGPRWHLARLSVRDGLLAFRDERVKPARAITLTPWAFDLKDIGTDSADGKAELHGELGGGSRLDWVGTINLQPAFTSRGQLKLSRPNLPDLMRWVPADPPVRIEDGRFSLDVAYDGQFTPEVKVSIADSSVALDKLDISVGDEPLAKLDSLAIKGVSAAWPDGTWGVDTVSIHGGDFLAIRDRDGRMRVQKTLTAGQPKREQVATGSDDGEAVVWTGALKAADISDIRVRFTDNTTTPATRLSLGPLSLKAVPETQDGQDTVSLDLETAINEAGKLAVKGRVGMPSALPGGGTAQAYFRGRVEAGDVALPALDGYVRQAARVRLSSGRLGLAGDALWQDGGQPAWSWKGDISLDNLLLRDSRDNQRLAAATRIAATGLDVQGEPNRARLGSLTLDRLFLRAAIRPDGQLNVATLTHDDGQPATTGDKPAAGQSGTAAGGDWPARIDNLVLRNATLTFADLRQQPAFSTAIRNFGGRISNVDLSEAKPARVELSGLMPPLGTIKVSGTVTPAASALDIDLGLSTRDIDLTGFSPYAGRYAGYRIEKGRLDTDLRYAIRERQLKADNKVLLKEFTWGDAVESPDATGLPVRLGTALLKDINGNIDIDMPLAGSLDDPKFRVWPLVWQTLGNLITRAAAAPFRLLGSLVGGGSGEDVSQVGFAPGSSALSDTARERVAKLADALKARSGLQLEVRGLSDPEADKAALAKSRQGGGEPGEADLRRLADARANTILTSLTAAGVPNAQIFRLEAGDTTASNGEVLVGLGIKMP